MRYTAIATDIVAFGKNADINNFFRVNALALKTRKFTTRVMPQLEYRFAKHRRRFKMLLSVLLPR